MIGEYTKRNQNTAYSDKVQEWFAQIDRGIEKRKTQEKRWEANESFEDMKQWMGEDGILHEGEYDQPTVNKLGSYIRTRRAALSFRDPGVNMKPKNAAAQEMISLPIMGSNGQPKTDPQTGQVEVMQMTRAKARETLINDIIHAPHFGLRDMISRTLKAEALGYGVVMTGYSPQFGTPLEKDTDNIVPVMEDGSLDFDAYIIDPLTGMPQEDEGGKPIKKNRIPVWEEWFIDWVHYRHMIIDPDGGNDFMKHRWVAMEQVRTLAEVKADPMFRHTKDLQETGTMLDDQSKGSRDRWAVGSELRDTENTKLVRLFHIYDLVKDRRMVMADGHGEMLLDEVMPMGITHCPFEFLRTNERVTTKGEEFYPRPSCTDLVPLVSENNEARRMLAIGRKRGVRKIIIEKGVLDEGEIDKLTNDEDLEVVQIDRVSQYGLEKTMHMLAPPPIGGDLYNNLNIIGQDFDEVAGQGSASRGKSTGDTATETNKLSQYEGTRYDHDRMLLKDMLIRIFKKLDDSIDANMTVPRAIQISGAAGQLHQVLLDRDMIACDCEIDIDLKEMTPTDDAAMSSRMIQFAQVIGQNDWMATNEAIVRTMAERVGITDENFIKGLVEAAQQKKQMEMQMLQMQLQAASEQAQMKASQSGKDSKVPEGSPPENAAQEASQTAAGQQSQRMQGAR